MVMQANSPRPLQVFAQVTAGLLVPPFAREGGVGIICARQFLPSIPPTSAWPRGRDFRIGPVVTEYCKQSVAVSWVSPGLKFSEIVSQSPAGHPPHHLGLWTSAAGQGSWGFSFGGEVLGACGFSLTGGGGRAGARAFCAVGGSRRLENIYQKMDHKLWVLPTVLDTPCSIGLWFHAL